MSCTARCECGLVCWSVRWTRGCCPVRRLKSGWETRWNHRWRGCGNAHIHTGCRVHESLSTLTCVGSAAGRNLRAVRRHNVAGVLCATTARIKGGHRGRHKRRLGCGRTPPQATVRLCVRCSSHWAGSQAHALVEVCVVALPARGTVAAPKAAC